MSYKDMELTGDNSIYMRLTDGMNRIRIASAAIPVWTEFDRVSKKATKWLDGELAKGHPEAKQRFAFWAIDRADGKAKMCEMGVSIMKQIKALANDPDYGWEGDIPSMDIKILREGSGMDTTYTITPSPSAPLTDEEKALIAGLEDVHGFFSKQPGVVTQKPDPNTPPF